jgi:hypothetical protein
MEKSCSLAKLICVYFDIPSTSKEFEFVYLNSVKYLIRAISASEYHKRVKTVSKRSVKKFRLQITSSGYYILNLKLHVINAVAFRRRKDFSLELCCATHEILKRDVKALEGHYSNRELVSAVARISKEFGGKKHLPSIVGVKRTLAVIMKRIERKIYSVIYTKLRFIANSGHLDKHDLKIELQAQIIQSYYWMIPQNKSEDHWVMTMLKTLKNLSINFINYWNAKKRARMVRLDTGEFIHVETTENIKVASNDDVKIEDTTACDLFRESMELSITTKQLIQQFATTAKKSTIIKLMMGIYDLDFTEWLKKRKHISFTMDNTDYQEQVSHKKFRSILAVYVRISDEKMNTIVKKLQCAVSGDCERSKSDDVCKGSQSQLAA